ncbi:ADP-ribose glycohydrolase MACROD2 [Penicillium subrubescens]|uniref:O-acetyl-ADP-ribose deacetylase MACROD2 n=1 Tax=Penicillium subrubescens TaxID=1316194 RepID=A0A1Q5ULN6_9EURO|nr:ADP-ribose glycohydrolase MACROD2 [Penicillium subrubescens]KAJ5886950.1 ADP-ribose glycohydrolase MACROD2 [Penicillium subrubescens]OKP13408.1 O-acetyl-ADP-ribose deacetylase MACROD2 [Penicillium subrubescens]
MTLEVLTLSDIPTVSSLYRDFALEERTTERTPVQSFNDIVSTVRVDITRLEVDCIVNAANTSLLGGGGVDGAIHSAAGRQLTRECATLDGCDVGDAKITSAYRLPCEKVVHTVGPIYQKEFNKHPRRPEMLLRSCYRRSLELAVENDLKSIAFAAISTGIYGYPSKRAAFAAADEVRKFLEQPGNKDKLKRVIFCNYERKDEIAYEMVLPKIFPPTKKDLASEEESATETEMAPKGAMAPVDDVTSKDEGAPKNDAAPNEDESRKDDEAPMDEPATTNGLSLKEDSGPKQDSEAMEDVTSNVNMAPTSDVAPEEEPIPMEEPSHKEALSPKEDLKSIEDVAYKHEVASKEDLDSIASAP